MQIAPWVLSSLLSAAQVTLTIKPKQRQGRWFVSNTWGLLVLCCPKAAQMGLVYLNLTSQERPLDSPLLGNSSAKLEVLS